MGHFGKPELIFNDHAEALYRSNVRALPEPNGGMSCRST
jgi:hypothetical protein